MSAPIIFPSICQALTNVVMDAIPDNTLTASAKAAKHAFPIAKPAKITISALPANPQKIESSSTISACRIMDTMSLTHS